MEENLKKDHMFSHQIEENERRRNNYSPNFQINRNHRRVRDNINIRNRPLDRRNVEIRIHTSNNNRNNNNNDHNRIRREELVYHARPFNRFIPIFLNDNINNKGKLTFPEIIIEDINKLDDANKSCTICLEEFKSKEKVTALPCFHYFHTNCINKWLEKKKFCPVCKFELTKENLIKVLNSMEFDPYKIFKCILTSFEIGNKSPEKCLERVQFMLAPQHFQHDVKERRQSGSRRHQRKCEQHKHQVSPDQYAHPGHNLPENAVIAENAAEKSSHSSVLLFPHRSC